MPSPAGVLRDSLPEDAPYYDEDRAFAMLEEQDVYKRQRLI